jgi:hypothetical protein
VPDRERFIVAGPPAIVGPLVETLARDPQATLVDVAPGEPAGPERFVVALTADRAAALQAALGAALTIERDEPLRPIDDGTVTPV